MTLKADKGPIKVSVAMITYNHERFVAEAIESVLMQETDFPIELVIGEDCSTDGTRSIVVEYAGRYPSLIRPLLPDQNLGMIPNFVGTMNACQGQYIALLEGDDYWTDPHKLQKQVDFLEVHPECSMCFHEAYDLHSDGRLVEYVRSRQPDVKPFYGLEGAINSHFIPTASIVFRNGLVELSNSLLHEAPTGDWALRVMLAEKGLLGFLDENMAVRRIHAGGVSSMQPVTTWGKQRMIGANLIDRYLNYRFTHLLRPEILKTLTEIAFEVAASTASPDSVEETIQQYIDTLNLTQREQGAVSREAHYRLVFRMYERGNMTAVQRHWWKTLRAGYRPALRNIGYWSHGLDALLGPARTAPIRRLLRPFTTTPHTI